MPDAAGDAMDVSPDARARHPAVQSFTIFDNLIRGRHHNGNILDPFKAATMISSLSAPGDAVAHGLFCAFSGLRAASDATTTAASDTRDGLVHCLELLFGERRGLHVDTPPLTRADVVSAVGGEVYDALFPGGDMKKKERTAVSRKILIRKTFNLLHEASEGFAKLLCLLGDVELLRPRENDPSFIAGVVGEVHALLGTFHLELCKVGEIILGACCARIDAGGDVLPGLYLALLDDCGRDIVVTVLRHMLPLHYPASDAGGTGGGSERGGATRAATIPSVPLLKLIAVLIKMQRLALTDVWCEMYPSNAHLRRLHVEWHQKLHAIAADKVNLKIDTVAVLKLAEAPVSYRNLFFSFPVLDQGPYLSSAGRDGGGGAAALQKIDMLKQLLIEARCVDALDVIAAFSGDVDTCIDVAAHEDVACILAMTVYAALGRVVIDTRAMPGQSKEEDAKLRANADRLDQFGGVKHGFLESVPSRAVLLDESDARSNAVVRLLEVLGPHIHRNRPLLIDLCTILDHPSAKDNAVAETLVQRVLLPALTLTQSDAFLADAIWKIIEDWSFLKRWRLYRFLADDVPKLYPSSSLMCSRAMWDCKQVQKRMTVDNPSSMSFSIAKLSHSQPMQVIDALLFYLIGYPADDTIVTTLVSMCMRNSLLTHDMTIYSIIYRMTEEGKKKLKADNINADQWFVNLSRFLSVFIRRIPAFGGNRPSVEGVIHFLFQEFAGKKDVMASLLLSNILEESAGVDVSTIWSEKQVVCQAGGKALISVTHGPLARVGRSMAISGSIFDFEKMSAIETSSEELRCALLATGHVANMAISIVHLSQDLMRWREAEKPQLKAMSALLDRMRHLIMHFSDFLAQPSRRPGPSSSKAVGAAADANADAAADGADSDDKARRPLACALLDVGLAELLTTFGLPLVSLFILVRPFVDYMDMFPAVENASAMTDVDSPVSLPTSAMVVSIDSTFDDADKDVLSTELLLSFWTLCEGDLNVPTDMYSDEMGRISSSIGVWETAVTADARYRDKNQKLLDREMELKKMKEAYAAMEAERAARLTRQSELTDRLTSRKSALVGKAVAAGVEGAEKRAVWLFLERCVFPRCLVSSVDAAFCASFPRKLMEMDVIPFDMATYFEVLVGAMPGKLLSSSEREAEHAAALLLHTLSTLDSWKKEMRKESSENENVRVKSSGYGSLLSPLSPNASPSSPRKPMSHPEFCVWLFRLHDHLASGFESALKGQTEYLMLNNVVGALTSIHTVFPAVRSHMNLVCGAVDNLVKTTELKDIKTRAEALASRLGKRKSKVVPERMFTLAVPPVLASTGKANGASASPGPAKDVGKAKDDELSRKRQRPAEDLPSNKQARRASASESDDKRPKSSPSAFVADVHHRASKEGDKTENRDSHRDSHRGGGGGGKSRGRSRDKDRLNRDKDHGDRADERGERVNRGGEERSRRGEGRDEVRGDADRERERDHERDRERERSSRSRGYEREAGRSRGGHEPRHTREGTHFPEREADSEREKDRNGGSYHDDRRERRGPRGEVREEHGERSRRKRSREVEGDFAADRVDKGGPVQSRGHGRSGAGRDIGSDGGGLTQGRGGIYTDHAEPSHPERNGVSRADGRPRDREGESRIRSPAVEQGRPPPPPPPRSSRTPLSASEAARDPPRPGSARLHEDTGKGYPRNTREGEQRAPLPMDRGFERRDRHPRPTAGVRDVQQVHTSQHGQHGGSKWMTAGDNRGRLGPNTEGSSRPRDGDSGRGRGNHGGGGGGGGGGARRGGAGGRGRK